MKPESYDYLRMHNWIEKGFLPNPGSVLDQPQKFLDAMEAIESELSKIDTEERKNRERRS